MTVGLKTKRYVKALFAVAEGRGERAALGAELEKLGELFAAAPELSSVISNPRVQTEARKSILMAIGLDTASDLLQDFVKLCLDHGRPEVVAETPEEYLLLDREAQGVVLATVQTADPMGADLRASVQTKLEEVTGKTIELMEETDPELIGGVRVLIGSRMYDGSLKRRLDDLTAHLQSTRVH